VIYIQNNLNDRLQEEVSDQVGTISIQEVGSLILISSTTYKRFK